MSSQQQNVAWITGEENGFPRPFGNYLLLAAYAQGGMGELFLAMHGGIAGAFRLCILKKLRPDLTNDREYVSRFVDEARVVVQLNHANVSHVFDVGRIEGQFYLAMEYVSGVSVKALLTRAEELRTTVPEAVSLFIILEVLEALEYAHHHRHPITDEPLRVVHRDVSPQNILVSWAGEVKLIDFGLALSALKAEHTARGSVMGKVAYMSPEQARGDEVDPSCDQFATAIVAYEMLAGERYYGDLPMHAIWALAGLGNFPPPKWSQIQADVQNILQRALQNDKSRRYDSCGDMREALRAYMATHHPSASERTLRELLDNWFKEYRAEERELLARFKDVTGAKVREAVKATETTVESLLSGPQARALEFPPSPFEGSGSGGLRPESSMQLQAGAMPAPTAMPSSLPAPLPSPLPAPLPPLPPLPNLPPFPAAAGTPAPFAGVESGSVPLPAPGLLSPPQGAAPAEAAPARRAKVYEPTERVQRDQRILPPPQPPARPHPPPSRSLLAPALTAVAAASLAVALVLGARAFLSGPEPAPPQPGFAAGAQEPPPGEPREPATAGGSAEPAKPVTEPGGGASAASSTPKKRPDAGKVKPRDPKPPPVTTTSPVEEESRAAKRARDRISTLKRSTCKDPCVASVVGQLETMPGAVELAGFQTSVEACVKACQSASTD
jgi:eukaryotic-like serine/threonine-protein kinase